MLLSEIIQNSTRFLIRKKSSEVLCVTEDIFPIKIKGYVITVDYKQEMFCIDPTPFEIEYNDKVWSSLESVKTYEEGVNSIGDEKLYFLSIINELIIIKK